MTGRTMERILVIRIHGLGSAYARTASHIPQGAQASASRGGTYRIDCINFMPEVKQSTYYGESARTLYDRGAEHLASLKRGDPESVFVEHQRELHQQEEDVQFSMRLVRSQ